MLDSREMNALSRRIRRDLVHLYDGDATAAAEAVLQICEEPDVLCVWATKMIRREEPFARAFTWDEVPAAMRDAAVRGMAEAYLLETWGGSKATSEYGYSEQA